MQTEYPERYLMLGLKIAYYRKKAGYTQEAFAEKIGKILALKEKYRKFFYEGRYVREEDPALPAGVKYGEFVNGDERMYALWNDSEETKTFFIKNQEITLNAQEVTCVCFA